MLTPFRGGAMHKGETRLFRRISLAIALLASAIAMLGRSPTASAAGDDRYVDRTFGFSFSRPHFTPSDREGVTTVAVSLAGPQVGAFAPSVNVVVQNLDTTIDAWEQRQQGELKSIGWELLDHSRTQVGEMPALRTHARGPMQGQLVEFLAIALIRSKQVMVLTCMASAEQFPLYKSEFDRVVASFAAGP
jgi:hypothetical protein